MEGFVQEGRPPRGEVTRREFFESLAAAGFLGLSGMWFAYVMLRFLFPPKSGTGSREKMKVAQEADVPEGSAKKVRFGTRSVWLARVDGQFHAYLNKCTHLGCPVEWKPAEHVFKCPCHAGAFDALGRVISPPPSRPLDSFKVEVRGGSVYVGEA